MCRERKTVENRCYSLPCQMKCSSLKLAGITKVYSRSPMIRLIQYHSLPAPASLAPPRRDPGEESRKTQFPGGRRGAGGAHLSRAQRCGRSWWGTGQPGKRASLWTVNESPDQVPTNFCSLLSAARALRTLPGQAAATTGTSPRRRDPATPQSQGQSGERGTQPPAADPIGTFLAARAPTVRGAATSPGTEPHTCDPAAPPPRRF